MYVCHTLCGILAMHCMLFLNWFSSEFFHWGSIRVIVSGPQESCILWATTLFPLLFRCLLRLVQARRREARTEALRSPCNLARPSLGSSEVVRGGGQLLFPRPPPLYSSLDLLDSTFNSYLGPAFTRIHPCPPFSLTLVSRLYSKLGPTFLGLL